MWANRIVATEVANPAELVENPRNWRIHPREQQELMADALDRIGWIQSVVVNRQTGHIVDGHLRVAMAVSLSETSIPVSVVDLTEEEEKEVLATLDPLGMLAVIDDGAFKGLAADLEDMETPDRLRRLIGDMAHIDRYGVRTPSQAEIDATAAELGSRFADRAASKAYVDIACRHCGEQFAVAPSEFTQ